MNKKLGIWVIVLFSLILSSQAIRPPVIYYNGSNNGALNGVDIQNYANFTATNNLFFNASMGFINGGFAPKNTYWANSSDAVTKPQLASKNMTINIWYRQEAASADDGDQFLTLTDGGSFGWIFQRRAGANTRFNAVNPNADAQTGYNTLDAYCTNEWCMITGTMNDSTVRLYINGTEIATATGGGFGTFGAGAILSIARFHAGSAILNGFIDEIAYFNYTLSTTEIFSMDRCYKANGTQDCALGGQAPPPPSPIGAFIETSPDNNFFIRNGSNFLFYAEANYTNNATNLSLFINGAMNETRVVINTTNPLNTTFYRNLSSGTYTTYFQMAKGVDTLNSTTNTFIVDQTPWFNGTFTPLNNSQFNAQNISINGSVYSILPFNATLIINGIVNRTVEYPSGSQFVNFIYLVSPGTYNYIINLTTWEKYNQSSQSTFFIDTVVPQIATSFINQTTARQGRNISGQFNFSDETVLFSWNISIDGVSVLAQAGLSGTSAQANFSYNTSGLSVGPHILTAKVSDGHTAEELRDEYLLSTGVFDDYLNVLSRGKNIKIEAKDSSISDQWTSSRQLDRFKFTFQPATPRATKTFVVTADEDIYIINRPDLLYQKWLVIGNKWIDFKIEGQNDFTININKTRANSVDVTIGNIRNQNVISFESIGELNTFTQNYTFYVFNTTVTYSDPILATVPTTTTLLIYKNTTAYSEYNVTSYLNNVAISNSLTTSTSDYSLYTATYAAPLLPTESALYNFTWNFSITNNTYSSSYSQTVLNLGINNCTNASWPRALFIPFYDEVNGTLTGQQIPNSMLNINLNLFAVGPQNATQLNMSLSGQSNYTICINPNGAVYNVTSIMQYTAPGMATRSYYIVNMQLSNITQTLPLFHIPSSMASIVRAKTYIQENSLPLPGAYVQLLRYYPQTNGYQVVEVQQSDVNGFSLFNLVPYNTFYRFNVIYQNQVVLQTSQATVYTTEQSLPVSLSQNLLYSLQYVNNIGSNVSCNSGTQTCSFYWADTNNLVHTAFFNVYRMSGFGKQLIYSQNMTSASGLMFYTITENMTGRSYQATGSIETTTGNSFYVIGQAELLGSSSYSSFGTLGTVVYSAMFLILVMGLLLIDIGPIGVVVGSWIGIVAGSFMGIIPFTWAGAISLIIIGGTMLWFSKS